MLLLPIEENAVASRIRCTVAHRPQSLKKWETELNMIETEVTYYEVREWKRL